MPDHMQCLRTLFPGDANFPARWRAIKIAFVKSLLAGEPRSPAMTSCGERGIWQRRYWEHTICDDGDFATQMDYAPHNSPSATASFREAAPLSASHGRGRRRPRKA